MKESLRATKNDPKAVAVDHAVGSVEFNGKEYAYGCPCLENDEEFLSNLSYVFRNRQGFLQFLLSVQKLEMGEVQRRLTETLDLLGFKYEQIEKILNDPDLRIKV